MTEKNSCYVPVPVRDLKIFKGYLVRRERARATVSRYIRDAQILIGFSGGEGIDKTRMIAFKEYLWQHYQPASCNAIIAGVNQFMESLGFGELKLRQFKTQGSTMRQQERYMSQAEFSRLLTAAKSEKKDRLSAAMKTIAMTGARISELEYFTVEAVRKGMIQVRNKGKIRTILLTGTLKKKLLLYAASHGIRKGCIFITASGRPVDRSNFWREMQRLGEKAHIRKEKLFPHNLRHLFARIYFQATKDLAGLGDILGHCNINVTRIYTMKTAAMQRRTLDKLNFAFAKKNTG